MLAARCRLSLSAVALSLVQLGYVVKGCVHNSNCPLDLNLIRDSLNMKMAIMYEKAYHLQNLPSVEEKRGK